jgi:tryptophan halogenase
MHICVVGTGAAGWITAHYLERLPKVTKITIVGSKVIPTIGVGESTTLLFNDFVNNILQLTGDDYFRFFKDIDAALKYGVSYEGWSNNKFLHGFYQASHEFYYNSYLLANKPSNENVNDYTSTISDYAYNNDIAMHYSDAPNSWHFDANKFISAMTSLAQGKEKITHLEGTAVDLIYDGQIAKTAILADGSAIEADYFISCIGQTGFNQTVFKEEYISYGDVLLTDKAVFYPLPYKNKKEEFHPYTKAKTMKYGWRWITPTWSRIGTGYVFSSKYITVEQAKQELIEDIGDDSIEPFSIDFSPRKVKKVFKPNTCTIGMASGFLEPLDAPGIDLSIQTLTYLERLIEKEGGEYLSTLDFFNSEMDYNFNFWASFILLQYKTSNRNDTEFWKDHKNVDFEFYEKLMNELNNETFSLPWGWEKSMFYHTMAGKGVQWNVPDSTLPKTLPHVDIEVINHYEALKTIYETY